MSSAGLPALALYDPQMYVQQQAIARKQALANALLGASPGQGAYGGFASAGKNILGAVLANRTNQDMANLYNPQTMGQSQTPSVPSSAAPSVPSPQTGGAADNLDAEGNPLPPPQAAPQPLPIQSAPNRPADYGGLPPQLQRLYDSIPHVPGLPARDSVNLFLTAPQQYSQAVLQSSQPSEQMKNAQFAFPGNPAQQQTMVGGVLNKAGTITGRAGNVLIGPDGQTSYVPPQAPPGYMYQQGPQGPYLVQIPGGLAAITASGAAQGLGKAATTPAIGYVGNQPVATNQANMLGYNLPGGPNINANNPLNMQPGGQQARYATPTAGFGTAWDNLTSYGKSGINTVAGIVHQWAPHAPPEYAANVARTLGVDPNQPLNLHDPNVKGLLIDAMRPNETGNRYSQPQQPMLPELPQGQATYMQGQGHDAAERHDATVAAASESPMRINVLDNIISLSQGGVASGPGQAWQNQLAGFIANTPGLSMLPGMKGAKDNLARFQELQKFTYQNAIRSWQAAGGTGTDAQMESMAHANPNDQLFPAALQQIAQWGKAAELAVQGKANAQDQWLGQKGQTPQNQIAFENAWRNAFDPKVFQYSLMTPAQKHNFAATVLKTPQQAKAFMQKQQALKQMGAIQ